MGEVVEMDSKGRIVIPSSIRSKFGLREGAQLVVETKDETILVQKAHQTIEESNTDDLKGFLVST